jgi:hypothetical protein
MCRACTRLCCGPWGPGTPEVSGVGLMRCGVGGASWWCVSWWFGGAGCQELGWSGAVKSRASTGVSQQAWAA